MRCCAVDVGEGFGQQDVIPGPGGSGVGKQRRGEDEKEKDCMGEEVTKRAFSGYITGEKWSLCSTHVWFSFIRLTILARDRLSCG